MSVAYDHDPEARAFVTACLSSPDDPAPRLIFADWLDEHGDDATAARLRAYDRLLVEELEAITAELTGPDDLLFCLQTLDQADPSGRSRLAWACLCLRVSPCREGRTVWQLLSADALRQSVIAAELASCGAMGPALLEQCREAAAEAMSTMSFTGPEAMERAPAAAAAILPAALMQPKAAMSAVTAVMSAAAAARPLECRKSLHRRSFVLAERVLAEWVPYR